MPTRYSYVRNGKRFAIIIDVGGKSARRSCSTELESIYRIAFSAPFVRANVQANEKHQIQTVVESSAKPKNYPPKNPKTKSAGAKQAGDLLVHSNICTLHFNLCYFLTCLYKLSVFQVRNNCLERICLLFKLMNTFLLTRNFVLHSFRLRVSIFPLVHQSGQ